MKYLKYTWYKRHIIKNNEKAEIIEIAFVFGIESN